MHPPKTFSVKLPTKTYLRKYIEATHGSCLRLTYHSTLGVLILCLLEKKYFDIKMSEFKKDIRLSYMNDEISLHSSLSTMSYKGHSLTPDKIIAINRYIENSFVEELYKYCKENIKKTAWRPGYDKAINSFAEAYGIQLEVDISFEALKKAENRHRLRLEKAKNNVVTFVPHQNKPTQIGFSYGITA